MIRTSAPVPKITRRRDPDFRALSPSRFSRSLSPSGRWPSRFGPSASCPGWSLSGFRCGLSGASGGEAGPSPAGCFYSRCASVVHPRRCVRVKPRSPAGAADGGPHQIIAPGMSWRTELSIDQPAATLWFHPHDYPRTAQQVIKGLAGLLIVDDEQTAGLPLPSQWGVDDIPLILQDRRFTPEGQFFDKRNLMAVTNGYVGDAMLVNGAHYPETRTARGWLRLRMLNGSNARSYALAASDGRSLYVIGSDGGLLDSPVELKQLTIHVGERFEALVDARDGAAFDLVTLPVSQEIMRLPPFGGPLPLETIR